MSSDRPPRFILYVRQSLTIGAPEESLSLVAQERALREMVARDGGMVLEPVIVDADEKGNDPNRPGIRSLLDRAVQEKPDGIAVYAVSRFARDNWLSEGIWRALLKTNPAMQFRSYTEPNAQDDLVRGILGVISEAERKRMGHFLRMAWAERARQGKVHGPAPYGYVKDDDGRLVIDDDARPWIEAIYRHAENGWSLYRIARWLRDAAPPVRKWEPNTIRNLLTSPAMAGGVQTGDTLVWEAHEPIIAPERWEDVQRILQTRRRIRTKNVSSWMEGVLRCSCGAPMSLVVLSGQRRWYPEGTGQFRCAHAPGQGYFRGDDPPLVCTAERRFIVQPKAERLAVAALIADLGRVLDWRIAFDRLERDYRAGQKDALRDRTRLERQRATLADRRDRTLTLYQLNKLDVARWETEDARLGCEIAALDAALAALPSPPDAASVRTITATLTGIRESLPTLMATDPLGARRFLQAIGACFVLGTNAITIDWPPDYAALFA